MVNEGSVLTLQDAKQSVAAIHKLAGASALINHINTVHMTKEYRDYLNNSELPMAFIVRTLVASSNGKMFLCDYEALGWLRSQMGKKDREKFANFKL